jgi:hypothetical protein
MKNLLFNLCRGLVRLLYTFPGRVRPVWRTLLAWCRIPRAYHRGGVEAINRKRKLKKDIGESQFPPYMG